MPSSRSKKRKLNHHKHNPNQKPDQLTHEEIWDDSALLRSWNDAVAEYEFYHSIHARGEDLDEVLKRYEMASDVQAEGQATTKAQVESTGDEESAEEGEIEGDDDGKGDGDGEKSAAVVANIRDQRADIEDHDFIPTSSDSNIADGESRNKAPVTFQHQETGSISANLSKPDLSNTGAKAPDIPDDPSGQTLENIKMAYYWAGYYSGLYDGQRQQSKSGTDTHMKKDG